MSTEKRPSTADEIVALITFLRDGANKNRFLMHPSDSRRMLHAADALEAQADQIKQAREQLAAAEYVIAAADSHIAHDFERRTHLEEVLMAYRECYPLAANPAPTTEARDE